jgi:hypothetical protein
MSKVDIALRIKMSEYSRLSKEQLVSLLLQREQELKSILFRTTMVFLMVAMNALGVAVLLVTK